MAQETNNENHRIKISDVYYKLGELTGTIHRIEKKLDDVANDHAKRLATLEEYMATLQGKLSAWALIFGFVGGIIVYIIEHTISKYW